MPRARHIRTDYNTLTGCRRLESMKQEVTTSSGTYAVDGTDFDLYIAAPQAAETDLPAVFVAHAWDGLNAPIEEIARRVAGLGYVAVAVDVYGSGVRGDPVGDNSSLIAPFLEDRSLLRERLLAGLEATAELDGVDNTRLGAIGYCFGGLCVLELARAVPENLRGIVSFHGLLTAGGSSEAKPITASVLIEHGWDDPLAPPADFLAFAKEMDSREADWHAHVYGGAAHAFTFERANKPEEGIVYDEKANRRSWKAMTNFFEEVL